MKRWQLTACIITLIGLLTVVIGDISLIIFKNNIFNDIARIGVLVTFIGVILFMAYVTFFKSYCDF